MNYISTANNSTPTTLKNAVIQGLAPDGGLFVPSTIPRLDKSFFDALPTLSFEEIALEIAKKFIEQEIPEKALKEIIWEAINFPAPIKKLTDNIAVLELFHGPTLAFKDFGARFMCRIMAYFLKNSNQTTYILAATSGDTGSAVGSGFLNIPGFEVIILYPSGKISNTQEKQLTTFGHNVTALEIDGTFDDCQKLVKTAFSDKEIGNKIQLSSANSINIARLIPQTFYYFNACAQLLNSSKKLVFSVPTGNLGNLTAGLIAKKMGLPIHQFIAAQNINNTFHHYLQTGEFTPKPSKLTISNAMDVGNPSNFERLRFLYKNNIAEIKKDICAYTISESETVETIKSAKEIYHYTCDPHGAVGLAALQKYLQETSSTNTLGVFLETAHPAKFSETVESTLNEAIITPATLAETLKKEKKSIKTSANYNNFKEFLLQLHR